MKYSVKLTDPWYRVHESIHSTEIVAASVPEARSAASRWAKTVGIGYVVSDGHWDCHAPLFGDQEFRDNPTTILIPRVPASSGQEREPSDALDRHAVS